MSSKRMEDVDTDELEESKDNDIQMTCCVAA